MAMLTNFLQDDRSTSFMSLNDDFQIISIYLLWTSNIDDEYKIQALFGKSLKFDLEPIERFRSEHKLETIVYRLEYKILIDNDEYTTISNENNNSIMNKYKLSMSTTKTMNIPGNNDDSKQRTINIDIPLQFLFDVHFQNHLLSFSKKGLPVEFWNQLCFYTYFLIKNNMYDDFTSLIQQFRNELNMNDTRKLSQHQLNMFFHTTYTYLPQIKSYLKSDQSVIKIFLQMFGNLPIEKENFKIDNISLSSLASELYDYIKIHLQGLLQTLNPPDWLLFIQGLTIFMSAQMLGNQTTFNTFNLLDQMKDYREKQELIINLLLKRLVELQMPIKNDSWTNLFSLTTDKHLLYDCLDLVTSLDEYLIVLQHVIKHNSINEQKQFQLTRNFDKLISRPGFIISLENILSILKHLQPQYQTPTCSSAKDMTIFQLIIKSSNTLRQKINNCLENLDINKISLESVCELFELDHFVLILTIDKTNYLIKTIVNHKNRTGHFYTTWFIYFLCDKYHQINYNDQKNFQLLLNTWLSCIKNDLDMLQQIIAELNTLMDHLQTVIIDHNDSRLIEFIQNMLTACFQPDIIFKIIIDICTKITNKTFLIFYEKKFMEDLLVDNGNKLKSMDDQSNPLYHLLKISKIIDPTNNQLLSNLITACTKLIKLNNEEIRYESFVHPTKQTCTYTILFDQHLNDYSLLKGTLNQLDSLWNRWIQTGLTISDIDKWKNHSANEQIIFHKIWKYVQEHFKKQESVEAIFKKTELDLTEKTKSREAIASTLNIYCDKAVDYRRAINSLQDMLEELHEKPIRSVEIPKDLKDIESIALKLSSFSTSQVWLHFYNRSFFKTERRGSQSSASAKPLANSKSLDSDSDDDDVRTSRRLSSISSSVEMKIENSSLSSTSSFVLNTRSLKDNLTVFEILNNVNKVFEEFRTHLNHICMNWKKEAIHEWIQLFSDTQDIHSELEILKSNLNLHIATELIDILNLWETRNFVYHVCQGCLNLSNRLKIPIKQDDYDVLKTLTKLDGNILGEKCSLIYQKYLNQYVLDHLPSSLVVWSQFSIATELIDFIVSLSSTDFDNLLENVNDGDGKLVSTKTVLDFATLKHYFNQVYKSIDQLSRDENRFLLPNILACFDDVPIDDQFGNIEEFFGTCSTELSNMRQSHLALTDKELSKRRLILNIMQKSLINFNQSDKFDVLLLLQDMDFSDLSELRERARLIQYSYNNNMKKDDEYQIQQFELFIRFVNTIETILKTLNSLYIAGHPIVSEIMMRKKEFQCNENYFDDLINFNEKLQDIFLLWENTLCEKYITYPELTYFSCKQFDMIEQFVYNKTECDEEEYGYHLLKYIGLQPVLIRQLNLSNDNHHTPEDRLENLGQILSQQRCLFQQNPLNKKIFLIETTDNGVLKAILSLCHRFNTTPNVNQFFFCTNETNWMEIRAFIYRSFYSQQFYQLIRPELLSIPIQNQIIHLIRQFIEKDRIQLFSLGIITTIPIVNLQLIDGLKSLQIIQSIPEQDLMNDMDFRVMISNLIKKCTIVTSRITGLGKSHTIREECLKSKREYIKFPVNGDIQADLIAKRLLKEASKFHNGAIHFDIGVIDNYHQINDLINCLVLFRCFCFGQIAISIPVDTPIYIELDCSSHSNLIERVGLFQRIPSIFIDQINWQKLEIRQSILFVGNYLKAIRDRTIITKDITLNKLEPLKKDECVQLIQEYFFNRGDNDYITWTKVFIYISVFYKLFLGFSQCGYFISEHFENPQLRQSRMDILQTFLRSADQFTSISVEAVRKQQRAVNNNGNNIEQTQELSNAIIRWDKIQPFTLIFSPTHDLIFVYKTEKAIPPSLKAYFDLYNQKLDFKQSSSKKLFSLSFSSKSDKILFPSKSDKTFFPDYKQLGHEELFMKLAKLSNKYFTKAICTKCFRQYEYDVLICENCLNTTDLLERSMPPLNDENIEAFQKRIAKIIESEYVLTADNYIKMLLVFLRVQSGVPVLIMGETGCGKTALINCLCRKILNDDLYVFRLHAGITNEKLLIEMNNLIIQAENLSSDKRLWIFFDEFNTIFNISLLKEIICERTLLGKILPENMVFLGTCNPQRQQTNKTIFNENVGIKKDRYDTLKLIHNRPNLLYTVTQIPETMLEYIWDYGHLDQDTEKKYIEATLKTCESLASNTKLLQITIELISESHKFLRELEDISSVSLRDVARYCRLYKWLYQYFANLDDNLNIVKRSSRLALLLCYYFRLDAREKKQLYLERLGERLCFISNRSRLTFVEQFEELLEKEETRLINLLHIPTDMARNRALKENLFVLFSCIINRIPVFLCGKPGASKTSAVQILMNNLKGLRSDNIFFRTFPELVAVTFQGSQNCTSKNIQQVFERAEKFMNIKTSSLLLPVIIFDEIGLAELSIHNPLKVLHEHLEIEECRFGFVGLSNWRLDASKMNRALYVACVDPDEQDLASTGIFLSNMHLISNQENQLDSNIIIGLARGYVNLQCLMKKKHMHENYFGLRDYYSLIKGIVHDCQKNSKHSKYEIIYQQLVINFGGITDGYAFIWDELRSFTGQYDLIKAFKMPNSKELIQKCLTNRNSRYLMLIVDRETTIDHVERYITTNPILNGSVKTLVGSHFEGDFVSKETYTESYTTRVLMEIILHAETSITLVMRGMNHLYDNLYDLFNQNFAISGRKKYCRIALSSIYNPRCFVHDDFYCVILLNAEDVDISDPPFLNRFQKHYIKIDELTQPRQFALTSQLLDWLAKLSISNLKQHFLLLKHMIIPYSPDYVCDLVIDICQGDDFPDEIILNSCKEKLIRASSFDFPLALSLNGNEDLIEQYYRIHFELLNISQLISSTFEQSFATKRIIYTYTNIYDTIDYENAEQIHEIKLSSIKTELELINLLKTYSQNKNPSFILLIRVDYHSENQHILSLKYNILNQWNELKDLNLWLIFHIQRNKLNQIKTDVLFNGWDIIMIDDLNNQNKFISKNILTNPSYEYFINEYQYKLIEDLFDEFIHRTLAKFRYENLSNEQQIERYNYLFDILNHEKNQYLHRVLQNTIKYFIKTISNSDRTRFKDWRSDLITNNFISVTSRSFNEALQSIIILFYDSYFQLLFHHFESFNLIDSYFYLQETQSNDLKILWDNCYKLSLKTIDNSIMNMNFIEIHLMHGLKLPYSIKENQILKIIEILPETLAENEDDLELFITKLLKEKSSYGENLIDFILNNEQLLDLYYHDQLILFHMEKKCQLSIEFILKLLTTNTKRSTMTRLIQLIAYPEDLAEILHVFEEGVVLFGEDILLDTMNQQLITKNSLEEVPKSFYSIVFKDDEFHLLPPNTLQIDDNFKFDPFCDPFIEISLTNLIEFLVCPTLINKLDDIEQIPAIFCSINQRLLNLPQYQVNNLEKLCSFMSLLHCIKTLNPTNALEIFQKCCKDNQFDGSFQTCDDIHQFIQDLERYIIQQKECELDQTSIKSILLKLEVEFLKNWLTDHNDQYPNIFKLINQTENNLWKYSAKIFSFIVGKLDLLENIECSYDQLPDESGEIAELDKHLRSIIKPQYQIHRLFVNRIHLDLILRFPIENHSVKSYLNHYYENFKDSIQYVSTSSPTTTSDEFSHVKLIRLLSWLKYYTQLYSFSLIHELKFRHLNDIDHYLTNNKLSFCSTLKLFILKQILDLLKTDLNTFRTDMKYQDITWLSEFLANFKEEKNRNERNLIFSIPFSQGEEEYLLVNKILSDFVDEDAIEELIFSCSKNQYLSYCFYLWFIKYYIQYSTKNFQPNDQYRYLFQNNLSNESKTFFQPVGIQFLYKLCTNFTFNSYFHLNSSMSDRDISIRMIILNIFALTLSFKSFPQPNWINTILFNNNSVMPKNYFDHFQSLCLFGLIDNDRIKSNMQSVRASVQKRVDSGRLSATGKYIYQCSEDCLYLFYFTHCGVPNQKSQCPFCQKDIGSSKYGVLIQRNPPQIKMTIEQGFQFIDEYIENFNRQNKFGYYEVLSSDQSTIEQKSDHLRSSISYRFLHLFLHSILFLLKEFDYFSSDNLLEWNVDSELYFQNHVEKDYQLLENCISDSEYCYVWLFQLLNNMLDDFKEPLGMLDSKLKVIQIEKLIEKQLIIPHSVSKIEKINKYKRRYIEFTEKEEAGNKLTNFLDERTENDRRYPFLNFFNVTRIFNQNRIEDFFNNLKTMPNAKANYPLTMYLLEHIDVWSNIQYLYPIIQFINYLRDKYNYRISRQQAVSKSIYECLNEKGEDLFKKCVDAWSKINLTEIRSGCQLRTFDRHMDKEKKLAFFSLNIAKDDSSLILSATLQTIAKLQNNIVNYFHNEIIKSTNIRSVPIHMIENQHLLHLDANYINSKIIKHALVINFQYGQSKDIIYDYEEIEMALRSLINRLPLINIDKFRKIQYQFELYGENNALISSVRHHIEQKQINDNQRRQYRCTLQGKDENDIIQYLGSLDYIFTYLQNRNYRSTISTIELFVNEYIHSTSFLNQNLFLQSVFSSIQLEYIIDLYELIEEIAFDKIFRHHIEEKLKDQSIENNQRKLIQDKFLSMTIDNKQIASSLHSIHQWIGTLKRFMVRILPDYIDLNIPIEIYLKRMDLWNCQITEEDIETIQLDDTILLKHTYIILIGLENRLIETNEQQTTPVSIPNSTNELDEVTSFKSGSSPKSFSLNYSKKNRKGLIYRDS